MGGIDPQGGYRFSSRRLSEQEAPERLARLIEVWRAQCAGRRMPAPEMARFENFAFALGHLHLIDVRPDGGFFFRLFGTASYHPLDYHKRPISDLQPPAFRELVEADYRECVALGEPTVRLIRIEGIVRSGCFRRVLLPYGPADGPPEMLVAGVEEERGITEVLRDPAFNRQADALVLEARG